MAAATLAELPQLDDVAAPTASAPANTALVPHVVEESRIVGYEAGLTAGHAEGFALGYEEAVTAAEAELEQLRVAAMQDRARQLQELDQAARAIDVTLTCIAPAGQDLFTHVEGTLAAAAMALAEAILGRELRDDATRGSDALARVLALAPARVPVTVRLHPTDAAIVREIATLGDRDIEIIDDATLSPGDAVAELGESEIDGRIASAVDRVRVALSGGDA
jgi:flagellar assembly protein FliH